MKAIRFNYRTDTLRLGRKRIPLEGVRQYLIQHYKPIVYGFYLRFVNVDGKPEPQFDWCAIMDQASRTGLINEYLRKHYGHYFTEPIKPSDGSSSIQGGMSED
jgi:hypothetical protein